MRDEQNGPWNRALRPTNLAVVQDLATEPNAEGDSEITPTAPAVVALVVTHNPGDWFRETLAGLAAQDYPNFSVLVIDSASLEDPTPMVAQALPTAFVRRLPENRGYAAAANEVSAMVEGATHFVFVHDDAALESCAVRLLVEEAFRSNAAIVGAKLVDWHNPELIQAVGYGVDRSGARAALAERGDLDQGQFDIVRDVFCIPGGCTLVRADLFRALGGFDAGMTLYGEDLDLCWRALVAGARVMINPNATVRHLEASSSGLRSIDLSATKKATKKPTKKATKKKVERVTTAKRELEPRHRIRAVFSNFDTRHRAFAVPMLIVGTFVLALIAVFKRDVSGARAALGAWKWNRVRRGELRERRRKLAQIRRVPDNEIRDMQTRGSAPLSELVRDYLEGEDTDGDGVADGLGPSALRASNRLRRSVSRRHSRFVATGIVGIAAVFLFGTRGLISSSIGVLSGFASFGPSARTFFGSVALHAHDALLTGNLGVSPGSYILGVLSVLFASTSAARIAFFVFAYALAIVGTYRFARIFGSARAKVIATVAYAALPIGVNAISLGDVVTIVTFAAAPWFIRELGIASGADPFGPRPGVSKPKQASTAALRMACVLVVPIAFAPSFAVWATLCAVPLLVASLLLGNAASAVAAIRATAIGAVVGLALLAPWSITLFTQGRVTERIFGTRSANASGLSAGSILRFATGPIGSAGVLTLGFVIAGFVALGVGAGWRFAWAVRLWSIAVGAFGLAWLGGRNLLPIALGRQEMLIAIAGAAVAGTIALLVVAFERDVLSYQFGIRQLAVFGSAIALSLAILPFVATSINGRWHTPKPATADAIAWFPTTDAVGEYRVLWLGDALLLPSGAREISEGLGFAVTSNGSGSFVDSWRSPTTAQANQLAIVLRDVSEGKTNRLGQALKPFGIRYIVLARGDAAMLDTATRDTATRDTATRDTATSLDGRTRSLPDGVVESLNAQVDLLNLRSTPAAEVFLSSAFTPAENIEVNTPLWWRFACVVELFVWAVVLGILWRRRSIRSVAKSVHDVVAHGSTSASASEPPSDREIDLRPSTAGAGGSVFRVRPQSESVLQLDDETDITDATLNSSAEGVREQTARRRGVRSVGRARPRKSWVDIDTADDGDDA